MSLYDDMAEQYVLSNVHALSTFLERQVRFAACIARAAADTKQGMPRLPRSTGLGGYLSFIRSLGAMPLDADAQEMLSAVRASIEDTANMSTHSLKQYRDFLAHGGLEPSTPGLYEELKRAVEENAEAIRHFIESRSGTRRAGTQYTFGDGVTLWPYFIQASGPNTSAFGLFQSLDRFKVQYYTNDPDAPIVSLPPESAECRALSSRVETPGKQTDADAADRLFRVVEKDLNGFRDGASEVLRRGVNCPFVVGWHWSTSSGSHYREDHFRVNVSGERQWLSGTGWQPYPNFLGSISHWEVVVQRSLHRLRTLESQRQEDGRDDFDVTPPMVIPDTVTTTFVTRETVGGSLSAYAQGGEVALVEAVDESSLTATGVPQVFFVTGEAGIGKTFNLLRESLKRAESLTESAPPRAPLYLFVSCSGVGIRSIDKLINDAVVDTRNLNFESVLALCRNGMIVLVIDGFDELLGGAGYGDAFQVLKPVLQGLGAHGTLLLAARSSYLANQYRTSLQTQAKSALPPPDHLIVELQRWSRTEVDCLFDANSEWTPFRRILSAKDMELIGVPFFARTFDAYVRQGAEPDDFVNLRWLLMDSYLKRESRKLETHGGADVVSLQDLRRVFFEVAGLMYESQQSTLSIDDFLLACAAALNIGDGFTGASQTLGDRLTVLCGFSADLSDGLSPVFAFQHDIFYEAFLGDFLFARCFGVEGLSLDRLTRALSSGLLGQVTIETIVAQTAPDIMSDALGAAAAIIEAKAGTRSTGAHPAEAFSANVSALVEQFLRTTGVNPAGRYSKMQFVELDFGSASPTSLNLVDCRIGLLRVGRSTTIAAELHGCVIERLEIVQSESLDFLTLDESTQISELNISGVATPVFEDGIDHVFRALERRGARGLADWASRRYALAPSPAEELASVVLAKMSARGDTVYVVETKSRTPGDTASSWMPRPGDDSWATLTDVLIDCHLAGKKALTAAGPSKCIVVFDEAPGNILNRHYSPRVVSFWQRLANAH